MAGAPKEKVIHESTFSKYCLVVDEWFVNGWNGTKAYQKFYPDSEYESADASFRKILENPRIDVYVAQKKEDALDTLKTSHKTLLQELENWAYSDITETLLLTTEQVKELPIEIRRLITKYKSTSKTYSVNDVVTTETIIELWFVSKEKAMEMIHKHVGFYGIDNKQKQQTVSSVNLNIDGKDIKLE
jgi:phage terminase small subunit